MSRGENALIDWLRQRFPAPPDRVPVGIGDDMAMLRVRGEAVAITADMLLDGVHFDTAAHSLEAIGRKAINCSLSDCAGMGCRPLAATVSLALPVAMTLEHVQRLYEGMASAAGPFGCPIVGGDTTAWKSKLVIDVAVLAEPFAARGPILRSTAGPGDSLFVSGPLGGSLRGKHLSFTPRLALSERLVDEPAVHALMDVSDGLSMDMHRMCAASGVDAELDGPGVEATISDDARWMSADDGRPPLDHALNDGEDFELLIAAESGWLPAPELNLLPVGRMIERHGTSARILMRGGDGDQRVIEPRGYQHWT